MREPRKPSERRKYRLLGIASDEQRKLLYLIIQNSSKKKWTRYAEFNQDGDAVFKRMSELEVNKDIGLLKRVVTDIDASGRQHKFIEFAI